jgi:hypothetical protein
MLKDFSPDFVDEYRTYTAFSCTEQSTIWQCGWIVLGLKFSPQ